MTHDHDEYVPTCPYCHDPIDYCSGHGEIGDPAGYEFLRQYDLDHFGE